MIRIRELEWRGVGDRIEASALGLEVFYRVEGQPGDWTLISPGAISDQSYAPAKYTPLPQVCARTWWGGLRYSIPSGATKHAARERCLRWLEGQ